MKREYLATFLFLVIAVLPLHVFAAKNYDFKINGLCYKIVGQGCEVVKEREYRDNGYAETIAPYKGNVIIPESVEYNETTYKVIGIRDSSFCNASGLYSVKIPNTITYIGNYAFYGCSNISTIEIPTTVKSIGKHAFEGCSGTTEIDGLKYVGNWLVGVANTNSNTYNIKQGTKGIAGSTFLRCNLSSIKIPNSVTYIGDYAFEQCRGLTSVEIPNSVTYIGGGAFFGCSNLLSIEIPNSVTYIGEIAFGDCTKLPSYIGTYMVRYEKTNGTYVIKEGTRFIGDGAFQNTELCVINIPNSVIGIGSNAFRDCKSLVEANIPSSVANIGMQAFFGCTSLLKVELPHSIQTIGTAMFYNCSSLREIKIPASVKEITNNAFEGCTKLTKVIIEDSPETLNYGIAGTYGRSLFFSCPIQDFYLGRKIKCNPPLDIDSKGSLIDLSISGYAQDNNNLFAQYYGKIKKLVLGSNVTTILGRYISGHIYSYSSIPPSVTEQPNYKIDCVHVPSAAYEAYKNDSFWGKYTIICDIDDDIIFTNRLTFNRQNLSLQESRQYTLLPTITPSNATIKTLNWTSSDEEVATVNNGVITAIKPGTATITATTTDGSNLSASCALTVTAQPSATFNFAKVSSLTPTLTPAEDEDDAINIATKTFTNNNVNMAFGLGSRSSYSARLWTLARGATELRTYNGATLTFSVPANNHIKRITITGDKVDVFSASTGTFDNGVWTGDAQTVVLNCTGTSNVKSFKVDYDAPIVYELEENGLAYTNSSEEYFDRIDYVRTFNNTNWQALYVPLTMKYDDWKDDFEVATINDVNMYDTDDDGTIDKTEIELIKIKNGSLVPNTPYFIKAKKAGAKTISLTNATLYPAEENSLECSSTTMRFTFTGTYSGVSGQEMVDSHYYALTGGSLNYASSAAAKLSPYRWYMKVEDKGNNLVVLPTAEVRLRVLGEDFEELVEANEIVSIETEDNQEDQYVTTDGRKLDAPIKGLNIVKKANGNTIKIWKK